MKFSELPIPPNVMSGIETAGFSSCTPIQSQTLPLALSGHDIAGQAQTGTGKTAAFLIALLTKLLQQPQTETARPRALILAPTRELVVQIEKDAQQLGQHCGLTIQAIYGGIDYMKQKNALKDGADIIIGTPGRLIDYLKQKVYTLKHIEMLVIDEADRMFDMGFIPDLRYILRRLPPFDKRQNLMFSATLNQRVMELSYEFMNLPQKVSVTPEKMTAERVEQVLYHIGNKEKIPLLLGLLKREGMERTILFVNTKREAERLHDILNENSFPCRVISGDVEQRKRMNILEQFKRGELPILIATDVASRGLHIEGVSHVINYDMPQDPEDYVHRIGRTARAGAEGKAISLADEDGAFSIEAIEEYIKHKIPVEWAEDSLLETGYRRPSRRPADVRQKPGEQARSQKKRPTPKAQQQNQEPVAATGKKRKPRRRKKPGSEVSSTPKGNETENVNSSTVE